MNLATKRAHHEKTTVLKFGMNIPGFQDNQFQKVSGWLYHVADQEKCFQLEKRSFTGVFVLKNFLGWA